MEDNSQFRWYETLLIVLLIACATVLYYSVTSQIIKERETELLNKIKNK